MPKCLFQLSPYPLLNITKRKAICISTNQLGTTQVNSVYVTRLTVGVNLGLGVFLRTRNRNHKI